MNRVVSSVKLTPRHTEYVIEAPDIASAARCGHIALVRFEGEERPVLRAIADFDPAKGTVTVVVDAGPSAAAPGGDGTASGAEIAGPFGGEPRIAGAAKVLLAAEGVGVAALLSRLRAYKEKECYTIAIIGSPSKDLLFWKEKIDPYADELYVSTDDGSFGIRGPIKHVVRAICENNNDIEQAIFIGSIPTMKAGSEITRQQQIPTAVSLAAVLPHEPIDTAHSEETSSGERPFDWLTLSDLDGHRVDFEKLTGQLGIPHAK